MMRRDGAYLWNNPQTGAKGKWTGERGGRYESRYNLPDDDLYKSKTRLHDNDSGGVYHYNGHPYLNDSRSAYLTMEKRIGDRNADIGGAYEKMGKIIGKTEDDIATIFSKEERTLHHTPDGRKLVSVDRYVHRKTPHYGGNYYNKKILEEQNKEK